MINIQALKLQEFIDNVELVNKLEAQIVIKELEIKKFDIAIAQIESDTRHGNLEQLCKDRNQANLERIELELEKNEIEKEILLFEKSTALNS